jgi:signal peptidase I
MGSRGRSGAAGAAGPDAAQGSPRRPGGRAERRRLARRVRRRRRSTLVREVPLLVAVALVIALVMKTFLVQAFVIPSGSMEQTIRIGDRVLVDKLTPWFGAEPKRGDVVVFHDPGGWLSGEETRPPAASPPVVKQVKEFFTFIGLLPSANEHDLIKRVIGVGGDTVRCCDTSGRITVNGHPLTEPYVYPGNPPSQIKFTVKVPAGRLFVMGDHRSDSADSRYHLHDTGEGTIPEKLVVGRAVVIGWPLGHLRRLKEPGTFAGVPAPSGASAAPARTGPRLAGSNTRQRMRLPPTPAELPLVMGMVILRRPWRRRKRDVRSGCGGPCGRRTFRTRRTREAGRARWAGGPGRGIGRSGRAGVPPERSRGSR